MPYKVPQFIEVEDKIFGPLTFKQFAYIAGGFGAIAILRVFVPFYLAVAFGLPIVGLGAALAFYRINDRPLVEIIEAGFYFLLKRRLYLWKKRTIAPEKAVHTMSTTPPQVPKLSESKLKELSWSLDIHEKIGPPNASSLN